MTLQTEFAFMLPRGYLSSDGKVHQQGIMRLATALDEIAVADDARVQSNEAYLPLVLLSRVIVQLGDIAPVTPQVLGALFASDLLFLEALYQRLNCATPTLIDAVCPYCSAHLQLQIPPLDLG